jgi:NodT family efflux transporter outer membrane factor (OMF) lipoprotein
VRRPNLTSAPDNFSKARRGTMRGLRLALWCASTTAIFAGCTVGPNYVHPTAEVPTDFKETPANWKQAQPSDAISKGKWWEIYQDPRLNELEEQINVSNQTLKAEQEQFAQARAALKITRSNFFPNIGTTPSVSRTHLAPNQPLFNAATETKDYNTFTIPVDVSWEPDLWGKVRRSVEASRSEAQATGADLANVSLSLHAELASDYFQLRGLDAQKQLLDSTVQSYEKALELTQSRYHGGLASAVDVAQAQTILDTTRAEATDVGVQRAVFEHAIAVLIGKPPADLTIDADPNWKPQIPETPTALPSTLLERRPDIAAAERSVAAANAQIGVAVAGFYPALTLSGSGGFTSTAISQLFDVSNSLWSVGASVAQTVFNGGLTKAQVRGAKAAHDEAIAQYRQTVLTAFQQVEDNIAASRVLQNEEPLRREASTAADEAEKVIFNEYRAGTVDYTSVVTAQTTALSARETLITIQVQRMTTEVTLIEALGGGWSSSQLPKS